MKMPGFNAEASLQVRGRRSWSGGPIAGAAVGVVPARPCCSACDDYCQDHPRSPFCRSCRGNCTPTC
jgi:hypothetical protein